MTIEDIERVGLAPAHPRPNTIVYRASEAPSQFAVSTEMRRPSAHGKFLFVGDEKFWVRGVTYGTFRPDDSGNQFPPQEIAERDFRAMANAGLNAVRVYTTPPLWLMHTAADCGLRLIIGLPWEQHVAFLDSRIRTERILSDIRSGVRRLAGHPALLCYAVGNEIPASVVRWYGKARIERFISRLCAAVKTEDPGALVTYVNFPTTEYIDVPCVDVVSFNLYLETRVQLSRYLARLQNLAGERPLLMMELGLDSLRNGEVGQAESLDWQLATAFEVGCVGAVVFAWTDEWFRGGHDIIDWNFGLTTRDRQPKAALHSVSARFASAPFADNFSWPKVSAVVCSYNGARTIGETLAALERLDYPDYEVIVIDDGSTDQTSAIAGAHHVRLIRTENEGLSAARNRGLHASTGEIVAYIDDDAYPDPHWLRFLAIAFRRTEHAGIGGPNLPPPADGAIADCVANAPGGPVHVLLSDDIAEHIPGCNMAYRRDCLLAIGGFDTRFRVAGDDVDICWRLQERGWSIGFSAAAVVWHHRRNSIIAYFGQQFDYAKAEALLADKWPNKYNSAGHLTWQGRLYGRGVVETLFRRSRIYHGMWGSAPFQSIYQPSPGSLASITLMPEWYFLLLFLGFMTALGGAWSPLLYFTPLFLIGTSFTMIQAAYGATRAQLRSETHSRICRAALLVVVAWLHFVQPAARLLGRIQHGSGPWSWKGFAGLTLLPRIDAVWSEKWEAIDTRLSHLKSILEQAGVPVVTGGDFDGWDLSIRGGLFGTARVLAMVEEHGGGRQLCRFRTSPRFPTASVAILIALAVLAGLASLDKAWAACSALSFAAAILGFLMGADCAVALRRWRDALGTYIRMGGLYILPKRALTVHSARPHSAMDTSIASSTLQELSLAPNLANCRAEMREKAPSRCSHDSDAEIQL